MIGRQEKGEWLKNKKEIKEASKKKGYILRCHCNKDELHNLATSYKIELTKNVEEVEEGWFNKPKKPSPGPVGKRND